MNNNKKFLEATYGKVASNLVDINVETEKGREELTLLANNISYEAKVKSNNALENNKKLTSEIDDKILKLNYKIKSTVEKLRGAILSERRTSGAIYTTRIPITKQQTTSTTTAKIEQGIAFGVSSLDSDNNSDIEVTLLELRNLNFSNLNLTKINKISTDKLEDFILSPKTQHSLPIEITINLTGVLRTDSSLLFEMLNHQIVEVYRNEELIVEKTLLKDIIVPVNIGSRTVTIRAYPSIHRMVSLSFKRIGYTELIYSSDTYFETKPITINKDFYQIVVDTCDNSSDKNIQIDYEISINNGEFEAFTPVSKYNVLNKQSIITTDKNQILDMVESPMTKRAEGDYRFYIPNKYQLIAEYKYDIYLRNNLDIKNAELFISVTKDTVVDKQGLVFNSSHRLYINDKEVKDHSFTLYKGIYKIYILNDNNEIQNINTTYLNDIISKTNVFINKYTKDILTDEEGMKYLVLQNKEFKNSFEREGYGYFQGLKPKKKIENLKLRAKMVSLDKRTVPFISRILIRGI